MKSRPKVLKTTLGELVVAVTDQVAPYVSDPAAVYLVVECILSEMVASERLRFRGSSPPRSRVYN
jgi:hypothetical protein